MTSNRPIRRDSKRYKAAMERYGAAVVAVLNRYNAAETPDAFYHYSLNTPAGPLRATVSGASIFQRFDDVEMGRIGLRRHMRTSATLSPGNGISSKPSGRFWRTRLKQCGIGSGASTS